MNKLTRTVVGNIVRDARIRSKKTQAQLGEKLGYESSQFVSLFERGLSKVPVETLGEISKLLKIPKKVFRDILVEDATMEIESKLKY